MADLRVTGFRAPMITLGQLLLLSFTAVTVAEANTPLPSVPVSNEARQRITQAVRGVAANCEIASIDGYGLGGNLSRVNVHCGSRTDEDGRLIAQETFCQLQSNEWVCNSPGTRLRFGHGIDEINVFIDPDVSISEGLQVVDACRVQAGLKVHYVRRAERGFEAFAKADAFVVEADVTLGDTPSCVQQTDSWPFGVAK